MSKSFDEAMKRARLGEAEEDTATAAKAKKLPKKSGSEKKSLPIRVMECELFDWDTTARMTLLVIALGQRSNPEAWVQEDCPWTAEGMVGYCDFSEWRIAQRVGCDEDYMSEVIKKLEKRGVLHIDRWVDSNGAHHNRYKIKEAVIDDNQRPQHRRGAERPSRYKVNRTANKGSFSSKNQPGMELAKAAGNDE